MSSYTAAATPMICSRSIELITSGSSPAVSVSANVCVSRSTPSARRSGEFCAESRIMTKA